MSRIIVPSKLQAETRTDQVDFSPFLAAGVTIATAVGAISVYTGIDPTPASVLVSTTAASPYANVKVVGGVVGVIYQLRIDATLTNGDIRSLSYFLAIIPDVV